MSTLHRSRALSGRGITGGIGLADLIRCVESHNRILNSRIDLVASNSWTSEWTRHCLGSRLCDSYSIGHPGQRLYGGCEAIDELEEIVHALAAEVFHAKHSCIQLLSGMQANFAAYDSFLRPGNTVMTALGRHGGHYSHNKDGPLRLFGSRVVSVPFDEQSYNIDLEALGKALKQEQPRLLVVGWSEFLFPHPLEQIREICNQHETRLMYDMSHVAGLIAGGEFQPEATVMSDIVTSSTGKSLHAPDHGLCLFNDNQLTESINRAVQPLLTSNTHVHEIAALGVALVEMKVHGRAYARQVIRNAQALGRSLENHGVHVLYGSHGYTRSHTLLIQVDDSESGNHVKRLDQAGITVNRCALPWDREGQESGLRLGTQVVTRRGMREQEMERIAEAVSAVIQKRSSCSHVFDDLVRPLSLQFQGVAFSFDTPPEEPTDNLERTTIHEIASRPQEHQSIPVTPAGTRKWLDRLRHLARRVADRQGRM